tara:strand:- start:47 stop:745 length:699 start_codon:yes stop_codon:yes gene_type:complete
LLKLNKKSKKLLLLQRNELLSNNQVRLRKRFGRLIFTNLIINYFQIKDIESATEKLFQKEIKTFEDYLPNRVNNILDVGCGLGILNIYLNRIFKVKPCFYLLDKNYIDKKIKYGFSDAYEAYNELKETEKILLDNGLNKENINLFNVDDKIEINAKIDLVISLKSMGYHYPFEKYLELFKKCCSFETVFIFDVGGETFDENLFKKYFENIKVIYEEKSIHSLKRLYCKNLRI